MGKEQFRITGEVSREREVDQIRRAARQFALLYFHFCKVLYESLGREEARKLVQQAVFEQAVDRAQQIREKALEAGEPTETEHDFSRLSDLPKDGWIPEWGEDHCPYGELWREYVAKYPWFREFAPFYCDVIDTTTIEHFTGRLSHRILGNVILEGDRCTREYFESEEVKQGRYTYGSKEQAESCIGP